MERRPRGLGPRRRVGGSIVDHHRGRRGRTLSDGERFARAGLTDYVEWRCGDAVALLERERQPFDFVLLDIWKELYVPCLRAFHSKLAEGAIVVADNIIYPENVRDDAHAYRAAVALIENNGLVLDLGANRPRAEERLFDYFNGRLSQSGVADWFRTWMTPIDRHV